MKIGKVFRFEAAHRLPDHNGKCARPHGHSYKVELVVAGEPSEVPGSSRGMVLDFANLKAAWGALDAILDHADLNEVLPLAYHPTTAENLARFIFAMLGGKGVLPGVKLDSVTVWETATSWARYPY